MQSNPRFPKYLPTLIMPEVNLISFLALCLELRFLFDARLQREKWKPHSYKESRNQAESFGIFETTLQLVHKHLFKVS